MTNFCYNILRLEHSDQSKLQEALDHFNKEELLAYFLPEPDCENRNDAEVIYNSKKWAYPWIDYLIYQSEERKHYLGIYHIDKEAREDHIYIHTINLVKWLKELGYSGYIDEVMTITKKL